MSSDSDSDDLFSHIGKNKIMEKFRKNLDVDTPTIKPERKSIFDIDEEDENPLPASNQDPPRRGRKRGANAKTSSPDYEEETPSKGQKFNPQSFLQQIQSESLKEASKRQSELQIVNTIDRDASLLINLLDQTERNLELQKQRRLKQVDNMPEEVITPISSTSVSTSVSASTTPTALPPNSVVEILQGDELAKAIDGECEAIEGKVTLVLRESGGEEEEGKKLVFRMPKVGKLVDIIIIYHCITIKAPFKHLLDILPCCGYGECAVVFDGENLNPNATPEGMDVEDLDIFDIELM